MNATTWFKNSTPLKYWPTLLRKVLFTYRMSLPVASLPDAIVVSWACPVAPPPTDLRLTQYTNRLGNVVRKFGTNGFPLGSGLRWAGGR